MDMNDMHKVGEVVPDNRQRLSLGLLGVGFRTGTRYEVFTRHDGAILLKPIPREAKIKRD